ncbi:MAG: DUF2892 domain-containing protein [Bacteroidetes bacterium]|nr:MAG: DUF2892 domain-containing protein [Bacteroidota bacterium]
MKKNMGMADKFIRILIAVVVGILYYMGVITGILGIVLLVFAGVFVLTSFVSFCPLYAPFGIDTNCKKKEKA